MNDTDTTLMFAKIMCVTAGVFLAVAAFDVLIKRSPSGRCIQGFRR